MKGIVVALMVINPGLAMAEPGDINSYCQRIARGSYQLEVVCIEQEQQAQQALAARPPVEPRILDYCNRIAKSWQIVKTCIEQEEAARAKLGR